MTEAVSSNRSLTFADLAARERNAPQSDRAEQFRAKRKESVAETVGRQADFSTSRAESLSRQADQLQDRARRNLQSEGLGRRVDITV
ncbi:hypothetical protein [Roseibium sediminis]|uniref:hypothetical protein n=1 Tax=Roseibium sediminis TaxID=1775174 RepID=UPI00123DA81E|nr:hypothetical protein [Roseibium sediminis]